MATRTWVIAGLVGLMSATSGCATIDYSFEPVFEDRQPPEPVAMDPVAVPEPPAPIDSSETHITFDAEGKLIIQQAWEAADGNREMAEWMRASIATQQVEIAQLIEAGQAREEQLSAVGDAYKRQVWYTRAAWMILGVFLISQ